MKNGSGIEPDEEIIAMIEKLIAGFAAGTIKAATLHVRLRNGGTETHQFGYKTEAEREQAVARLVTLLGRTES